MRLHNRCFSHEKQALCQSSIINVYTLNKFTNIVFRFCDNGKELLGFFNHIFLCTILMVMPKFSIFLVNSCFMCIIKVYVYNQSQFCDVGIMLSKTSAWDFLELVVVIEQIAIAADYLNFITNQVCFFTISVNFVIVVWRASDEVQLHSLSPNSLNTKPIEHIRWAFTKGC